MGRPSNDRLFGTLDLLVLRTLSGADALHGYDITERIKEVSRDVLKMEEGSLYPALHRMEEAGWLKSRWDVSDNNRRARFYVITAKGRQHLKALETDWARHVDAVTRVLKLA
jgi:PadR family transcriptional regulator PadR